MDFNPNYTKQADEVIFIRKAKEIYHPLLVFDNASVSQPSSENTWVLCFTPSYYLMNI